MLSWKKLLIVKLLSGQYTSMSFIHMEPLNVFISKSTKHPQAADTEDYLLTEAIILVPSVKEMGQRPVPF
jgi:hypothetical protein